MKGFVTVIGVLMLWASCTKKVEPIESIVPEETNTEVKEIIPQVKQFGFMLNDFMVVTDTVRPGDSFGGIMDAHGVTRSRVYEISSKIKDSFNVARLVAGKKFTILKSKDTSEIPQVFIYQPNSIDYTVIDLRDSIVAYKQKRPISYKRKTASGVIISSLSQAMEDAGLGISLTHRLSNIYQWSVDFFKIQKGDQFKLIYTEKYVNDTTYVGIENVEAAVLKHYDRPYYAFEFVTDTTTNDFSYFDETGKSLQSFFLKAPLQFSRISSRFTRRRFHPVQKRWKAHKGTDYAAPRGTPIWSTANGTVTKAGYTGGNGKYVKIKHNKTYSTQYLHMSKILVKKGQRVKQGDVIGLVGSTGLATGPHVCYRFWKNGRQVDPYAQKLPSAKDIEESLRPAYMESIQTVKKELDSIPFQEIIETEQTAQEST